ncbi:MAG TPA: hypothetical protein DCQ53_09275 [Alphaproteobacteria bacterium]|jgi:hypothetical protein|nr:hypothetical protein [Alphaproteobacteria bacterium]
MKRSLPVRWLYALAFLVVGGVSLLIVANYLDPEGACEEAGGVWLVAGRHCVMPEPAADPGTNG